MDYKKAGVDIEAGYKSVELMKEHVRSTMRAGSPWRTGRILRSFFSGEDQRDGRAGASVRDRRMRNQGETGDDPWISTIPSESMPLLCV